MEEAPPRLVWVRRSVDVALLSFPLWAYVLAGLYRELVGTATSSFLDFSVVYMALGTFTGTVPVLRSRMAIPAKLVICLVYVPVAFFISFIAIGILAGL